MRSVRLAVRTLFRSPFLTSIAILSLALGIGANAAIFSIFNQILLRPLPVADPDRLVNIVSPGPRQGTVTANQTGDSDAVFSYALFRDIEAADAAFSGVAGHRTFSAAVAFEGNTRDGEGVFVSGSYFPLLGLQPARGRLIAPADDEAIGAHPVAVLSYAYWESNLGSDNDVVGRTLIVNGQPLTIIGVAPRGFFGTTLGPRPSVFVPITMRSTLFPNFTGYENRNNHWVYVFARLAPGAGITQATAAINATFQPIIREVEAPLQAGMSETRLAEFMERTITLEEGRRGQSRVHADSRMPLLLLLATAGLVLLIACANIANLLLARGAGRGLEMAVRLSLGATRQQVLRQLLTESVVLAAFGGAAGLLVAQWTLAGIGTMLPPEAAAILTLRLDATIVAFAAALALATGILFGLFPALHSTRDDLVTTIRANAGNLTATRAAARFRATLVTSQIGLAMLLLIMAGLFLRSLANIATEDLHMNPDGVVVFAVSPSLNGYDVTRSKLLYEELEAELAALPGVTAVTTSMVPLLTGSNWMATVSVEGFERGPDINSASNYNEIGADYFATLGIPILSGREFTDADREGRPSVAIVNESFANRFGLGRDAVGRRMAFGGTDELTMEIVGVVSDSKYADVKEEMGSLFYVPWRQQEQVAGLMFYVRTGGDPALVMGAIPRVVATLDPNLPVRGLATMPRVVRDNVFLDRLIGTLSASFAVLATLLAAIGLYGMLAYSVVRRTREIGVRIALGADGRAVRSLVLRQVGIMLAIGGTIGIVAALALGRVASSLLFGLNGSDPLVFASSAVLLSLLALAAGYLPARRAARVNPLKALRFD